MKKGLITAVTLTALAFATAGAVDAALAADSHGVCISPAVAHVLS